MSTENSTSADAAIRTIIDDRVKAIRAKDLDAVIVHHAPDVLTFDLLDPLHYSGVDKVRERAMAWFSSYHGQIGYEVHDLEVSAGDDVAFCHYLYHVTGTLAEGGDVSMWCRATTCLRKRDGAWRITHEHQSVPFDAESGHASLSLEP